MNEGDNCTVLSSDYRMVLNVTICLLEPNINGYTNIHLAQDKRMASNQNIFQ